MRLSAIASTKVSLAQQVGSTVVPRACSVIGQRMQMYAYSACASSLFTTGLSAATRSLSSGVSADDGEAGV